MNSPLTIWVHTMEWPACGGFTFKLSAKAMTREGAIRACEAAAEAYHWRETFPTKRKTFPHLPQAHARWRTGTGL